MPSLGIELGSLDLATNAFNPINNLARPTKPIPCKSISWEIGELFYLLNRMLDCSTVVNIQQSLI